MEKQVFKIKTQTDLQLSIQNVVPTLNTPKIETEEVMLNVFGYNQKTDSEIECCVFISKQESKRLIKVLGLLSL